MMDLEITSNSVEETIEVGRRIGEQLKGGEVLGICGPLGAGKTCLIKGICGGAGAAESGREVVSPTFVIVKEYAGRFDIYHVDAYRLESAGELDMTGFDDFCYPESVVLIEWADKVEAALEGTNYIRIKLNHLAETSRRIRVENAPGYIVL
jgi:tRNA threonylcarbamoyladenosine biosynthesis protein TsaE